MPFWIFFYLLSFRAHHAPAYVVPPPPVVYVRPIIPYNPPVPGKACTFIVGTGTFIDERGYVEPRGSWVC